MKVFKLLPFFAFVLLTFNAFAQEQPEFNDVLDYDKPKGPITSIEFEETVHDFGEIISGEKITHVFTFTNTGDEPLVLISAKGSCGCTVPSWPKEPIQPGETASITVQFNSKNKRGKRNQKVTIQANTDPDYTFLYLQGNVLPNEDQVEFEDKIAEKAVLGSDCVAIYPNPTSEILKLDMEANTYGKSATVTIVSQQGQTMAQKEIPSIEGIIEFNVNHYPAGSYYAVIMIDGQKLPARCFLVSK